MATFYFDSNWPVNGSGANPTDPIRDETGTAFGANVWYMAAGSTWDMGGTTGTGSNGTELRKYGTGADPVVTGTNATALLDISTANSVLFDGIRFERGGSVSGFCINADQVGNGATPGLTMRNCTLAGNHTTGVTCNRSDNVLIQNCTFTGGTTQTGIKSTAQSGADTNNLHILGNTFSGIGAGVTCFVSDTSDTNGKFAGLRIEGNTFDNILGSPITMRSAANSISTSATTSVTAPSTLTRSSAWPVTWAVGKKIFLGGFTNAPNFGLKTVATLSGVTLTVSETDLTTEGAALNKGIYLMDADQAFIAPRIVGNTITRAGQTPMLIDNFIGGLISGNTITDSTGSGANAAAIEMLAFHGVVVENNTIRNMRTSGTVDAMGVFADGGCENCVIRGNDISDLPGTAQDNSGAGLAVFYAINCTFYGNVVKNAKRGFWAGGTAGTGHTVHNNTFAECDIGYRANGSPPVGSITVRNNLMIDNAVGISDSASSVVAGNAWWRNAVDNAGGALASKDATAITADPLVSADLRPLAGSPLIAAGAYLGPRLDFNQAQFWNPPAVGAHEYQRPRALRT